ncbi:unnamed protein product [Calicophoron daubneyi]|uniref:Uncharacterized protein n=1 Tax=Calicophoron daubneyi TaxID=300641 RepID=A0AAV2TER7_CALDB
MISGAIPLFLLLGVIQTKFSHGFNESVKSVILCDPGDGTPVVAPQAPLTRIISVCDDDLKSLCNMVEFRAYLHISYEDENNKTTCHTVPVDMKPTEEDLLEEPDEVFANTTTYSTVLSSQTRKPTRRRAVKPDIVRVITGDLSCCDKFIRCASLVLGPELTDPLNGWRINLTWLRTPEPYEFGEVGWSSVGAPLDSLSGVYDLVRVDLTYRLTREAGFSSIPAAYDGKTMTVSSIAEERFQARVGDFYECASNTDIVLTGENVSKTINGSLRADADEFTPGTRVILALTDIRSQAFADFNVPEFTGASVVCVKDTPHDGTMSIVIGLSICALLILVLLGLAVSHLKDKDRSFKPIQNTE